MTSLLIALQLAASEPAPERLKALEHGWSLFREAHGCFIESPQHENGSYVTIFSYVDGKVVLFLSNPSWKSLQQGRARVILRIDNLISKKSELIPIDATTDQMKLTSRHQVGALAINIGKKGLASLANRNASSLTFFKEDAVALTTDVILTDRAWDRELLACAAQVRSRQIDPFAK